MSKAANISLLQKYHSSVIWLPFTQEVNTVPAIILRPCWYAAWSFGIFSFLLARIQFYSILFFLFYCKVSIVVIPVCMRAYATIMLWLCNILPVKPLQGYCYWCPLVSVTCNGKLNEQQQLTVLLLAFIFITSRYHFIYLVCSSFVHP